MNTKLANIIVTATACALSLFAAVGTVSAQSIGFIDFATLPSNKNLGTSLDILDGAVTITARSSINPAQPFEQFANGLTGTIYNVGDKSPFKSGLGVQTLSASGSKGISGGGPHANEELIFTYNNEGAIASSISVQINLLNFGDKAVSNGFTNLQSSDPIMFINYNSGSTFLVTELALYQAATALGRTETRTVLGQPGSINSRDNAYLIDFGAIAGLDPNAQVNSFTIRETNGHTLVKAFDAGVVPEPSGAALLLSAYGFLMMFRRRSRLS